MLVRCWALLLLVACTSPSSDPPPAMTVASTIADAPSWTVRYGDEFWRRASRADHPDIGDVVERVTYAIRDRTSAGPSMRGRHYTATFDGAGVVIAETRVQTRSIAVGDRVHAAPRTWSILGNTAQGRIADGIVEHHELGAEGDAISWVVHDRIEGDLTVELAIDDPDRVRVGAAELVDAAGRRTPIATTHIDGALRWHVDVALLADATYPIALDPIVGPELGTTPPTISYEGRQFDPAVASNGAVWLVVWMDLFEPGVYGTRIASGSSTPLDANGIAISPGGIDAFEPGVASNGTDFLVAWQRRLPFSPQYTIRGARVTGAGVVVDPASFAITDMLGPNDNAQHPAVASNGTDYLVAWEDNRGVTNGSVYGSLVSASGAAPVPNGFLVADAPMRQRVPAVASNGSNYVVVWQDERDGFANIDIYGARVTFAGVVEDPAGFAITGVANQEAPAIASSGGAYLVAWSDTRNAATGADIYGARVAANGTVTEASGIPIAIAANRQYDAVVTGTAAGYLVGWSDGSPGQGVYAARVENGVVPAADANGILLAAGHTENQLALSFDGVEVLAAWWSTAPTGQDFAFDVAVRRIAADGTLVDASPTFVSAGPSEQYDAKIAASASGFLVVWSDDRDPGTAATEVLGTRVSATGTVLDVNGLPITLNMAGATGGNPAVVSNGTDYLVVFERSPGIFGTRVLANGTMPDGPGILIRTGLDTPVVASDGVGYLVIGHYTAFTPPDNYDGNLDGAFVSASGVVGASLAISNAPGHQYAPAVGSTKVPGDYLVVWRDTRHPNADDVYGARISGGVRLPGDLEVFRGPGRRVSPKVASDGASYLVAWGTAANSGGTDRAQAAIVSAAGVPGVPFALPFDGTDFGHGGLASTATGYLVGFTHPLDGGFTLDAHAMRLSSAGISLDGPDGFVVANSLDRELVEAVACAPGGPCLLAYDRRGRVRLRLISFPCGNGIVDSGETCDDGNQTSGDGCGNTCVVESGHTCTGVPSTCSDIDECASGNGGCAQICTNSPGSFACSCSTGYTPNGPACNDMDECATANGGCAQTCTNTTGSFACSCTAGYTANGLACDDIDECATANGGCAQTCTNTTGSFTCSCSAGYTPNGAACDDIDECATGNGGCAEICSNTPGGFTCGCLPGYEASGGACVDIDECATNNGGCADICTNTPGGFACEDDDDDDDGDGGGGCSTGHAGGTFGVLLGLVFVIGRRRRCTC